MCIMILNSKSGTMFILKDVLYSLDTAVTLISVGRIDMAGYTTTFGGGTCIIQSNQNKVVRQIPIRSRLYHIDRGKSIAGNALVAEEVLTIMELHHCMGHIAPDTAKHLVTNGVVQGIKLNSTTVITTCDSCMYAKMMHTPVPKERKGGCATVVGAEVHTDVWGLSWFTPRSSMSLRRPDPFPTFRIDLRPHWVVGLLPILSHRLSYASIILLYLVLSILLDNTSTSDLCP